MSQNERKWKAKAAMAVGLGIPISAMTVANPAAAQPDSADLADYETAREDREQANDSIDRGGDGDRETQTNATTTVEPPATVTIVGAADLDFGGGIDFGTNADLQSDNIIDPNFDILADPAPQPDNLVELSSANGFDQDGIDRGGDGDRDDSNDTQQNGNADIDEIHRLGAELFGQLVPPDPFDRQLHDLNFGGGLDFGANADLQSDNIIDPNFDILADPAPQPDNLVELSSANGFDQDGIDRGGDGDRDDSNDTQQNDNPDAAEINRLVLAIFDRLALPPEADPPPSGALSDRDQRLEAALNRPARLGMRPMRGSQEAIELQIANDNAAIDRQIAEDNPNLPQAGDGNSEDNGVSTELETANEVTISNPDTSDTEPSRELTEKEKMEERRSQNPGLRRKLGG